MQMLECGSAPGTPFQRKKHPIVGRQLPGSGRAPNSGESPPTSLLLLLLLPNAFTRAVVTLAQGLVEKHGGEWVPKAKAAAASAAEGVSTVLASKQVS